MLCISKSCTRYSTFLYLFRFTSQQIHKFFAGLCLIESTAEIAGCRDGVLFFYTAHLHTHMFGFDDDHHAQGMQCILDTVFNLLCETLLHLQPMAENIDNSRYFA